MWIRIAIFTLSVFVSCAVLAQLASPTLNFDYEEEKLGDIIVDLEKRYGLHFTYSSTQLPMDFELTAKVDQKELESAIGHLFQDTPIKYAFMSNQIMLRADRGMLAQLETKKTQPIQKSPIYREERHRAPVETTAYIPTWKNTEMVQSKQSDIDQTNEEELARMATRMEREERYLARKEYDATHRLAQISLLPYLGTNTHRSKEVTNTISINIFWGASRAIDGFEFGGIANSVTEDMRGFQFGGALNQVGGKMTGTQTAGILNHVSGKVDGVQLALAGGNIGLDSVKGVQLAMLFNVGKYHVEGGQFAGLFNWTEGNVRRQKAFLFNRAEKVRKRQVGLFNFCDTTAKAPIGLLSFVKQGYNRLEIGGSEEMFIQLGGKLGTHKLYNILQLGLRWDHVERMLDGQSINGNFTSWSFGYGFGIAHRLGKKSLLNTEVIAHHVNELEQFTRDLNLLGQFKMTFDYQPGNRLSIYLGPSFNIIWSNLYDSFSGQYGSIIAPRTMWHNQKGKTNTKTWIGFTAGIRI